MARCDVCGNDYDKSFQIVQGRQVAHFRQLRMRHSWHLRRRVSHCGCRIIGHGMEAHGEFFCCAYCAKQSGAPQMKDRAESTRRC